MNTTYQTATPQIDVNNPNPTWLAFSFDHDEDDARQVFALRYDVQPAQVKPALGGMLFVGPVPALEVT